MKVSAQYEIPFPIDWDNPQDRSGWRFKWYEYPRDSALWVPKPEKNLPPGNIRNAYTIRFKLRNGELVSASPDAVIFAEEQSNFTWALVDYKGERVNMSHKSSMDDFIRLFPDKNMVILNNCHMVNKDWLLKVHDSMLRLDLYNGIVIVVKYHSDKFVIRNLQM